MNILKNLNVDLRKYIVSRSASTSASLLDVRVRVCAFSLAVVCRRVCTPHAPSPMPGVLECHPWCGEGCPTFGRVPDPYGLRCLSQYVTPPVLL